MAKKDDRIFIRLHVGMPEHPKIEGLSDKAFRLLVESWCWGGRNPQTDGQIPAASWRKRGTARARKELLEAGLYEDDLTGGVIAHDWDDWQRTWDEIQEFKREKSNDGALGAHRRWHVNKGKREAACEFCNPHLRGVADG